MHIPFLGAVAIVLAGPQSLRAGELHDAAETQNIALLRSALLSEEDPNELDMMRGMPLHIAARNGWNEGVVALVAGGADPFADDGGGTAVAAAAAADNPETLAAFIEAGIDVTRHAPNGRTALHSASAVGATEAIRFLVAVGMDVGVRQAPPLRGEQPLQIAALEGNLDAVEALLALGADAAAANNNYNQTSLHYAVIGGSLPVVRRIVAAGAPINSKNGVGKTALDLAISSGRQNVVDFLRSVGAATSE